MKTMIAIPCMDMIHVGFAKSLLEMEKPEGTSVSFRQNSLVYDSRNLLTITARENHFDRVLWLDSDMLFKPDIMRRMEEVMDKENCDLVTGLYFKRTLPTSPVLFRQIEEPCRDEQGRMVGRIEDYTDYPENSVFKIAGCGLGCALMTVDLLMKVWDSFGPPFAPYPWAGEDISFCYRAGMLGAKMMCDSRIKAGHIGMIQFTEAMYERRTQDGRRGAEPEGDS